MLINEININEYLENNNIFLNDNYFLNNLNLKKFNVDNTKLKNYINNNDYNNSNEVNGLNYHLFFIHSYNEILRNILFKINEINLSKISEINNNKIEENILMLYIKTNSFKNKLYYKKLYTEKYLINLIPQRKIKQFKKDNPNHI